MMAKPMVRVPIADVEEAADRTALRWIDRHLTAVLQVRALTGPRPGKTDRQIYDCEETWVLDVTFVRGEAFQLVE